MTYTSTLLSPKNRRNLNANLPSRYTMKVILGYSAALHVVHSKLIPDFGCILN